MKAKNRKNAEIIERYNKRDKNSVLQTKYDSLYQKNLINEREKEFESIIKNRFQLSMNKLKFIEIGAGTGINIDFVKRLGFSDRNVFANEINPGRIKILRKRYPEINVIKGDALDLSYKESFDIVMQSTLFTSVLNEGKRKLLASKMFSMLRDGGIILWYDFIVNNPRNPDVRKVTKNDIIKLFPQANKITFKKVTLAPPIGRMVGNLFSFFNHFKFLRTHLIAVIE